VDRDARLGGKLRTDAEGAFLLEAGPDSFLTRKPAGLRLAQEIGLEDRLLPRSAQPASAYVTHRHVLCPIPEGFSGMVPTDLEALGKSPVLSGAGRDRALQELSVPAARDNGDVSVASFMERRYGQEAFQLLIEPMLSGIYAADARLLSLDATFPHLRAMEREHGSLTRAFAAAPARPVSSAPPFLSFVNGMEEMARVLAASLDGARIHKGMAVHAVTRHRGGYRIATSRGNVEADACVFAVPADQTARILAGLSPSAAESAAAVPFSTSAIVHLAYAEQDAPRPLVAYGYLIPAAEGSLLLGCTWMSQKWKGRAPEGALLLRLHAGRYGRDQARSMTDQDLVSLCRAEVKATLEISAAPVLFRVHRWENGMPQYTLGHTERRAAVEASLAEHPGLFVAGSSWHGVGIPDCIESGERAAAAALAFLGRGDRHND